jgi:DNA polymerase-4
MARGIDNSPIFPYYLSGKPKSISRSKTFPQDIYDEDYIKRVGLFFCCDIASELKKQNLLASSLGLYLRFSDFSFAGGGAAIKSPTALSTDLFFYFKKNLEKSPICKPIRKVGVWAGELITDNGQTALLKDFDKKLRLEKTAENINKKFARNIVTPASLAGLNLEQSPSYGFQKRFIN